MLNNIVILKYFIEPDWAQIFDQIENMQANVTCHLGNMGNKFE